MNVNNIFITGYSLDITSKSSIESFNDALDKLDNFLKCAPSYNNIETCENYLFDIDDGESLDDLIYEISGFSDPDYTEMLKDLNQIIIKSNGVTSATAIASSDFGLAWNGEFIGYYSQSNVIPNVIPELIVSSVDSLFELNYKNLSEYPINESSFNKRAQLIFNNINYHVDFESTLSTVKSGDFKLYSIEFSRCLRALHNAFPRLSSKGHNPPDLNIIKEETEKAGRTMDCTPQGSDKANLCNKNFKIKLLNNEYHELKNLNCEYHLKINFDNKNKKLDRSLYNRAYFGLPLIKGKKYIALLHLGKHYDD